MFFKSIGRNIDTIDNIEIEKEDDKLIRITPSFKIKLSDFIKSIKNILIEKYQNERDYKKNIYVVSFSQEKGEGDGEENFSNFELLLGIEEFLYFHDMFLLKKLDEKDKKLDEKDKIEEYIFLAHSNIDDIINKKFKDTHGNIIHITSLTEKEKEEEKLKQLEEDTINLLLNSFFKSDEYQLSPKKEEKHPLLIDLNALRRAKNLYLYLYLHYLVEECANLNHLNDDNFKYKFDLITKYNSVNIILQENSNICQRLPPLTNIKVPPLTDIKGIIKYLSQISEYEEIIDYIYNQCYTKYTFNIFNHLKSLIDYLFHNDDGTKTLLNDNFDKLIEELKENNDAYADITGLKKGGNHFITLLNHCNLSLKKEKKHVKKATEKKPVKKASEKKPVKKAAEKKPVKKGSRKEAHKETIIIR